MITRFCEVKVNTFEMTEEGKGRILNREMEAIKKNQMENLELENTIFKI